MSETTPLYQCYTPTSGQGVANIFEPMKRRYVYSCRKHALRSPRNPFNDRHQTCYPPPPPRRRKQLGETAQHTHTRG